jgi:DNA-directed RNA polymerase specialized sigma24 family protein
MPFPSTRHSVLNAVRSTEHIERTRAWGALIEAYWKPVYIHVRMKWRASNEDAADLTQGFFTLAMEKSFFDGYDAARASFRTFLRTCLDGYVSNEQKAATRIKRGGTLPMLDFDTAERELARAVDSGLTAEECFHREWVRSLFGLAVDALRQAYEAEGKQPYFRVFQRYDLDEEKVTYDQLAIELGLNYTDVVNYLAAARRRFRKILLDKLREITADEREFEAEARYLLGR